MLRYKLRTLLIVVALLGGPLARLAYLKQMARHHRQAVSALIPKLCQSDRLSPDEAHYQISFLTANASHIKSLKVGHPHVVGVGSTETLDLSSDSGRAHLILDQATLAEWKQAFAHEIIASRFDRTFFHPWETVDTNIDRIFE